MSHSALVGGATAVAVVGVALAFTPQVTERGAMTPAHAVKGLSGQGDRIHVVSELPDWRAPGVPLTVSGFAAPGELVFLRARKKTVARGQTGPQGGFSLKFRTGAPGRYRLTVAGGGVVKPVGSLLVRSVLIDAVGDITFGESVGPAVEAYGGKYPWTGVASTLSAADIATGNLETTIGTRGTPEIKEFTFQGPRSAAPAMAHYAGLDVLTLANNHSKDYGSTALLDTLRYVRATGIKTIGAGANSTLARKAAFVNTGGLRIAFLGYSDVNPAGFPATSSSPGTAAADVGAIDDDVHSALRHADMAVCFFHWGTELHPDPDSRQQMFAAACLNAGAKLVLGAHPHVFGAVARPTKTSLVAWTLGNFVFPSYAAPSSTNILQVFVDGHGVRGYKLIPIHINGFRPELTHP